MKKNLKRTLVVLVSIMSLMVVLAACGASTRSGGFAGDTQAISVPSEGIIFQATQVAFEADESEVRVANQPGQLAEPAPQRERVILRDASLTVIVEDTTATITSISELADGMGGWVVTANSSTSVRTDDTRITNGNITVRVPAEQLDSALMTIRDGALEVQNEAVNGRDVTEEYVDLTSRVTNLEATEDQLVEILDSAYTVEDVLAVQSELTTIRGQIEQIEGRLRFFDEASAFSSISVTVREQIPSVGNVQVAGWNPLNTAENAFGQLIVAGQFLVDAAIALVILGIPTLVVVWFVVMIVRRAWRALRGSRPAQRVTATE